MLRSIGFVRSDHLDSLEVDILNKREAFHLPPQHICDDLVDIFFSWIAPVLPVVNKRDFMRKYYDRENPPSILLLQAIFMTASRFYRPQEDLAAVTPRAFYKKTKALYDVGYELNEISVLQAVVLMSLYWDGPNDLTENGLFYWSRLGIALAQLYGLHQHEKSAHISRSEKGLRKRIWWTLYTRDRAVAAAFGRPLHIDLDDCTIEPLAECDFIEFDEQSHSEYPADKLHMQFFMQYIRLCRLMEGLCLKLSSRSTQANRSTEAAHCELGLNEWLKSCPAELVWRQANHNFWSAVLHSTFNAIICQKHLLQVPHSSEDCQSSAFHAASTIISIMETLQSSHQLQYSPSFIICHALVSFATLKSQMNVKAPSLLHIIKSKLDADLDILDGLSRTWPIATMFLELFQTMVNQGQFDRALSFAVEKCRKRAYGDESDDDRSRPTKAFKRTKMGQVMLPENRVILQVSQREARKRHQYPPDTPDSSNPKLEHPARDSRTPGDPANPSTEVLDELGFSWDKADPSTILQSIHEFARTGELCGQTASHIH